MLLYALLCYALLCVPNVPKSRLIALNCCNNGLICDNYLIFTHSPGNAGAEKTREAEQNGDTSKAETSASAAKSSPRLFARKQKIRYICPHPKKYFKKQPATATLKKQTI